MELIVRPYQQSDKNFIMSTMVKGMYHGCYPLNLSPRDECVKILAASLEHKLDSGLISARIVCDSEEPDLILGYLIVSVRGNLVWAYTKNAFRKRGILNKLLSHEPISTCTNITAIGNIIRLKKGLTYRPWES